MFSLSSFPLFFHGQINNLLAIGGTTTLSFFITRIALNKQEVTGLIGTVNMAVARRTTLVTLSDYMLTNSLRTAFVEYKVFSDELIF